MKNKIKEIRENLGMTQEEFSEKSGVSRTVISQLENGTRTIITSDTMLKISRGLEKPVNEIFLFTEFTGLNKEAEEEEKN